MLWKFFAFFIIFSYNIYSYKVCYKDEFIDFLFKKIYKVGNIKHLEKIININLILNILLFWHFLNCIWNSLIPNLINQIEPILFLIYIDQIKIIHYWSFETPF